MSKGLGKKQKMILDKAAVCDWFYLTDLLPPNYADKDYQALYRAFRTLLSKGIIQEIRYKWGLNKILVGRINATPPDKRPPDNLKYKCLSVGINSTT